MTEKQLRQAAIDCLAKAFAGGKPIPDGHVLAAAVSVLLAPQAPTAPAPAVDK